MFKVIRMPRIKEKTGLSANSSVYAQIQKQTLVPLFKIGARASGCFEHEVDTIMAARAAGKSEDEIRTLVKDLVAMRTEYLKDLAMEATA